MSLTNPQIRQLKALAQRLDPIAHVGKAGVTDAWLASIEQALNEHELIKIKFSAFKEQKKTLAAEIVARTHTEFLWIVGHVAVLYRQQADPARRKLLLDRPTAEPTPGPACLVHERHKLQSGCCRA